MCAPGASVMVRAVCDTLNAPPRPNLQTNHKVSASDWAILIWFTSMERSRHSTDKQMKRRALCRPSIFLTPHHSFSLLSFPPKITLVFFIILFLFPPFPPSFSSYPPPHFFLIPVHKTHQTFSVELGNEADL